MIVFTEVLVFSHISYVLRSNVVVACLFVFVFFFLPAVRIRLFIKSEVISGPDLRRSSEENVALQERLGEVHRAFVGQTELHQEQTSGPAHVPKDETAAHLSQGSVQEDAQDFVDKEEEAQKGLEQLSLADIKAGLQGTKHTMKIEGQEEAIRSVKLRIDVEAEPLPSAGTCLQLEFRTIFDR